MKNEERDVHIVVQVELETVVVTRIQSGDARVADDSHAENDRSSLRSPGKN